MAWLLLSLDGGRDVRDGRGYASGHRERCDDGDHDGDDRVYGGGGDGGFGLGSESGSAISSECLGLGLGDCSLGDGCGCPLGAYWDVSFRCLLYCSFLVSDGLTSMTPSCLLIGRTEVGVTNPRYPRYLWDFSRVPSLLTFEGHVY